MFLGANDDYMGMYRKKFWCNATFTIGNEIFHTHLLQEDHELIQMLNNEEIDIADSAGSSLEMTSSFTMQRVQLMHYWT